MPNKYDKLANDVKVLTDEQFKVRFSSLTKLSDSDISRIINDSGISKEDLTSLLMEIKNATAFNNKTAQSVMNITNGVQALLSIAKKLLL
jgi:hypothetical protein